MTPGDFCEMERLIARQGLPETRDTFDQDILRTIETISALRSVHTTTDARHRRFKSLAALCLLISSSLCAFSIGRWSHSSTVATEQPFPRSRNTTSEHTASQEPTSHDPFAQLSLEKVQIPLAHPLLDQLVWTMQNEETVWGSRARLPQMQFTQQSDNSVHQ